MLKDFLKEIPYPTSGINFNPEYSEGVDYAFSEGAVFIKLRKGIRKFFTKSFEAFNTNLIMGYFESISMKYVI